MVWNCAQFITAAILPIHKYVDEIWLFDGAYKHMEKFVKVPWSTDGTEEIVKALKLDSKLIWVPCKDFFTTEVAKKNFMVQYSNDGEWIYDLVDDEIAGMDVKGAFERIRNSKDIQLGLVPMLEFPRARELFSPIPEGKMYTDINPYEYVLHRMLLALREGGKDAFLRVRFLKNEGLHFRDTVSDIYDRQGRHYTKWSHIVLGEMFIWHIKWLREKDRLKQQLDYEQISPSLAE